MVVATLTRPAMTFLLDICSKYSIKWRFNFSGVKSNALIFGPEISHHYPLKIGDEEIAEVKQATHLGIPVNTDCRALNQHVNQIIASEAVFPYYRNRSPQHRTTAANHI